MSSREGTINFNRGIPAPEAIPVGAAREAASSIFEGDGKTVLEYCDSRGYPPLRGKIAEDYEGVTADGILLSNGSLQLLDLIARLYLGDGKVVVVERPTYDRAITIFERAGAKVKGVDLEDGGINVEGLEEAFAEYHPELYYTIPDFQNPTGATTTTKKRKKVAWLLDGYDVKAVEDSPYRRLRYSGETRPSLRSFNAESVIQTSSFSKLVSPGVRVGWLVADSSMVNKIATCAEDTYISPNILGQGIVTQLIKNGWLEENIERLKSLYRPRLQATLENLEKYFPKANWVEAEGGFFVGVWLPDGKRSDLFYEKARSRGLVLTSPLGFFPDKGGGSFLRLPFPALTPKEIESGIKRIAEVWKDLG
ncbi:PLP-dependent aminotransferase family protein [Candidatus Bipolaricaulota bacterium]|nr:PLP-dependent aminotransferase family protein [Candidatus Bipolaricaulota bacterium]